MDYHLVIILLLMPGLSLGNVSWHDALTILFLGNIFCVLPAGNILLPGAWTILGYYFMVWLLSLFYFVVLYWNYLHAIICCAVPGLSLFNISWCDSYPWFILLFCTGTIYMQCFVARCLDYPWVIFHIVVSGLSTGNIFLCYVWIIFYCVVPGSSFRNILLCGAWTTTW